MNRFSLLFLLLIAFTSQASAQRTIKGSGRIITQERNLTDFTGVSIQGAVKAEVRRGSAYSVSIEMDDNVTDHVESFVSGDRLVIKMKDRGNYNNVTVRVTVTMPELQDVKVYGASRMEVSGFSQSGERMDVNIAGASFLRVKNSSAALLDLKASGASSLDLSDFDVERADINFSGASSAKVSVRERITGRASGASSVRNSGGASVDVSTSGASHVR